MIAAAKSIWQNGTFVPWDEARVHVLTHAFNHGTGAFEGIRSYATPEGPALFRLRDHIDRLLRSARILLMDLPYTSDDLAAATIDLVRVNDLGDSYVRMIAYRDYGELGINLDNSPVGVAIAAWDQPPSFVAAAKTDGVRMTISSWRRAEPNTIPAQAKIIGGYVTPSIARAEAVRQGFDDAVLLSPEGKVSEATIANLFVVRTGALATPPAADGPLIGFTRDTVMTIAAGEGRSCTEQTLTRADLYSADEIFVTSTGAEVVGVREVDGRSIGIETPGPVTRHYVDRYEAATHGTEEQFTHWLTWV